MNKVLLVALGGCLGSVLRYLVSAWVQDWSRRDGFPLGTLAVNVIGCLAIGVLSQSATGRGELDEYVRAFVLVGILGGFTTFSAFGNETMNLLADRQTISAFANIVAHVLLGLGAVWLGRSLGGLLFSSP